MKNQNFQIFLEVAKKKQWENGLKPDQKNLIEQLFKNQMIELEYL